MDVDLLNVSFKFICKFPFVFCLMKLVMQFYMQKWVFSKCKLLFLTNFNVSQIASKFLEIKRAPPFLLYSTLTSAFSWSNFLIVDLTWSVEKSNIKSKIQKSNAGNIQVLRENLDDDMFTDLANHVDYNGESPVDLLALKTNQAYNAVDTNIRWKSQLFFRNNEKYIRFLFIWKTTNFRKELYLLLLTSGAISAKSPSPPTASNSSTQHSQ